MNNNKTLTGLTPKFDRSTFKGILIDEVETLTKQTQTDNNDNFFPVEVFPVTIQTIINETNNKLKYPIDYIGSSLLYAASVAIGNTYKIEIKRNEFIESAALFMVLVGPTGCNKSSSPTFALKPLEKHDKQSFTTYGEEKSEYDKQISLSKGDKSIEEPEKPVLKKMIISDYTLESLHQVHSNNPRGLGIYIDELAGFFKNMNRYNKGSDQEAYLQIWSGKRISIDRKSSEPISISNPFVSICGTIQNSLLSELSKDSRNESGFMYRFLFAFPENIQKEYWSENEINPSVSNDWNFIITELLRLPLNVDEYGAIEPTVLMFTPDAKRLLFEWQRENTDEVRDAKSEVISGINCKMETYAARFALILEMLYFACGESNKEFVGLKAIEGAIKLAEYFKKTALRVSKIASNNNPLNEIPLNKQQIFDALPDTFETNKGWNIAEPFGVNRRTFERFLNEKAFFIHAGHGEYKKQIILK